MQHHLDPETIITLLASLAVILASAELFTNGIEWLGHRLALAEGAVGSVLAAVGTALPETFIPFVAILIARGEAGSEIGLGAILGAPFMLATLAMFITGVAALVYRRRRAAGAWVVINQRVLGRDLAFFLIMYAGAVAASFAPWRVLHIVVCLALLAGYCFYLRRVFADPAAADAELRALRLQRLWVRIFLRPRDGEDAESYRERRSATANGTPRTRVILGQVLIALLGIIGGAYIFVGAAKETAASLGIAPLLIALIIAPIATELPEKFNSIVWMRQGKDTYALGNITGAMVFQSSFPVSLGLAFTAWRLLAPTGQPQSALYSAALALAGGAWLLVATRLARREEYNGDHAPRIRLNPGVLLVGGLLYAVFVALLVLRV
jgi:cation:H+ antiporter